MAMFRADRFYWDSCAFLAWLLPENDRVQDCREVLDSAELGECLIVTSSLTLVEVIKLKLHPPVKREQEKKIRSFFENDYIEVRLLDRRLAEAARQLIWEHGVSPKDAVHVATALSLGVDELHTYDNFLLDLDGKLEMVGGSKLRIRTPAARQRRIDIGVSPDAAPPLGDSSTEPEPPSEPAPAVSSGTVSEPEPDATAGPPTTATQDGTREGGRGSAPGHLDRDPDR